MNSEPNCAPVDGSLKPLLKARQAAALLNISERALWTLTDTEEIPVVRIGRSVRYDPRDLDDWIRKKKNGGNGSKE